MWEKKDILQQSINIRVVQPRLEELVQSVEIVNLIRISAEWLSGAGSFSQPESMRLRRISGFDRKPSLFQKEKCSPKTMGRGRGLFAEVRSTTKPHLYRLISPSFLLGSARVQPLVVTEVANSARLQVASVGELYLGPVAYRPSWLTK